MDPDRRSYTATPIDTTNPIEHERGLSQMSMTGRIVHNCWRVAHSNRDREVYCAQRRLNEKAWGAPTQMTGGQAGKENHGYLLHPVNHPRRLAFTTYQKGGYADPKAVTIRLEARAPKQKPKWITISDPNRQGDFAWLAEDSRGGLHVVWQEADANSDAYEIWHAECQAGTTDDCSELRHWDKSAGAISQPGGKAKNPQIVITPSDDIAVAYQQQVNGKWRIRVAYRCHETSAWQHVAPDGQLDGEELWLGEPAFVLDSHAGEVHVVYRVTDQSRPGVGIRWARRAYPECASSLSSLNCASKFSLHGVSKQISGTPLLKRTLTGAEAKCNDGSPAVMYIRPALDTGETAASNQWIIHFQGGRGCTNADDCRARWCSEWPQQSYSAGKMSSEELPSAISSQGIFSTNRNNQFRRYNHVFLHYCSSDYWIGAAAPHTYSGDNYAYSIEFRGAAIVDDVIGTLKDDAGTWSDPLPSGDPVWLPDIDRATHVLLTGSSAGSIGLRHHVDRLHEQLRQANPNVIVRAVVDVGFFPFLGDEAIHSSPGIYDYDKWLTDQSNITEFFWQTQQTARDQSCMRHTQPRDQKQCLDPVYVLKHHITTPFFISQDLHDKVWSKLLRDLQLIPENLALQKTVYDQLHDLGVAGIEPRSFSPGVFAPHCNEHEFLSNANFFKVAVGNDTLHATLSHWFNQQDPVVVIQDDNNSRPSYALSKGCSIK